MGKMKKLYQKMVAKAIVAAGQAKQSVENVANGDAGLSDAVVTVIILLAGVVCAILVYKGAKGLITTANSSVTTQANTLITDMSK